MKKRILITGAKGFSARYLTDFLLHTNEADLFFCDLSIDKEEHGYSCDLSDFFATRQVVKEVNPGRIYHLAGSFHNDFNLDYKSNVLASKNIMDSVLAEGLACRILVVGSAAEYGIVGENDNPVKETHPLNPVSIYGLTKLFQTNIMNYYATMHSMDLVMARTFNLLGPGMSTELFAGRLYREMKDYKSGKISKIALGNLEHKRDYLGVQDAVKQYHRIMEKGASGEVYNVGSGFSIRISDLLDRILSEEGLDRSIIEERPASRPNKFDIKDIFADISKLKALA